MYVGLHKINKKREEDAANNFTNLYVKNIGNMTVDELKELFAVSLINFKYTINNSFIKVSIVFKKFSK